MHRVARIRAYQIHITMNHDWALYQRSDVCVSAHIALDRHMMEYQRVSCMYRDISESGAYRGRGVFASVVSWLCIERYHCVSVCVVDTS